MKKTSLKENINIRKIKKKDGSLEYYIGDTKYNNFEDLQERYKQLLEDKNRDGIPDRILDVPIRPKKIIINGKEYNRYDEIPEKDKEIINKIKEKGFSIRPIQPIKSNTEVVKNNSENSSIEMKKSKGFFKKLHKQLKK